MMEKTKSKSREIDIIGIVREIFSQWKTMIKFIVVFLVIGVVVALSIQKTYTTTVVLTPESSDASSAMSKLGSVGSMLGLKMSASMSSDAIYPQIYPEVFASNDFMLRFMDTPVTQLDETESKSYKDHLIFDSRMPFWAYPKYYLGKLFEKKDTFAIGKPLNPFRLSKEQTKLMEAIKSNITCSVDKKNDIIYISVTDFDPQVSALMADTVMHHLQDYITLYRTSKARHDLEFIQTLHDQALMEYREAQEKYAAAADSHKDIILVSVSSKIEELENDMQVKFNAYSEAVQQLQMAKQQVQEKTPAFTVIQSATIPVKASSTPRAVIVALFLVIGVFMDAVWVLWGKKLYLNFKKKKVKE